MIKIDEKFDARWGDPANQWSGKKVRTFLQETLKEIIGAVNKNETDLLKLKPLVIEMDGSEDNPINRKFSTSEIEDIEVAMEIGRMIVFHFKGESDGIIKFPHYRIVESAYKIKALINLEYISFKSWTIPATVNYRIEISTTEGEIGAVVKTHILGNTYDDGTYGIKNGKLEGIAGSGYGVLAAPAPTPYSIAINALNAGVLNLPPNCSQEMVEEVMKLLGEETFAELSQRNVKTLELHPSITDEQKLQKAREAYEARKIREAQLAETTKQKDVLNSKQTESTHVEPLNND